MTNEAIYYLPSIASMHEHEQTLRQCMNTIIFSLPRTITIWLYQNETPPRKFSEIYYDFFREKYYCCGRAVQHTIPLIVGSHQFTLTVIPYGWYTYDVHVERGCGAWGRGERHKNEMLWGISECSGCPIFNFFIKENWILRRDLTSCWAKQYIID